MQQFVVYLASVIGAAGMYLMLAQQPRILRVAGAVLGLGALAWVLAWLGARADGSLGAGDRPTVLFYLFAVVSLGCAVRMITHPRPVYSALYFVMVVLSAASIFLLLEAEFMAFALIIVYAGAILITYLFVLMLAQQAPTEHAEEQAAAYDRVAREPLAAVAVGFVMLALLMNVVTTPAAIPPVREVTDESRFELLAAEINRLPRKRAALVALFRERLDPDLPLDSQAVRVTPEAVVFSLPPSGRERQLLFADAGLEADEVEALLIQNIEQVGIALVQHFPVSLELAGVILLMAMFGAVVLARKQIELGEDERREAAGLEPLSLDEAHHPDGGEAS
ncbi:MAG: NADH-quinone oxidoreductase subunit J [Phycisphaerales bacterium]